MREEDKILAKKLANEHWEWFHNVVGHVAMDFFVHGYKHGFSDTKCHNAETLKEVGEWIKEKATFISGHKMTSYYQLNLLEHEVEALERGEMP